MFLQNTNILLGKRKLPIANPNSNPLAVLPTQVELNPSTQSSAPSTQIPVHSTQTTVSTIQTSAPIDPTNQATNNQLDKNRKNRQRWGKDNTKMNGTNPNGNSQQEHKKNPIYQKIEEINLKLKTGLIVTPEDRRSPSPEPLFNSEGKQVNTREIRYRKKLEDERHKLIEQALKNDPNFKPPTEHKKPVKFQDKYFIPVDDHPEINFIGLLIGPRGNTLKRMEMESGAKISIRGRGSVKDNKRNDGNGTPGNDEELHCLISADSSQKLKKAKKLIEKIIETSANVPEGQNELKRQQLRELAALNGTLREDEVHSCTSCGGRGHRQEDCPESMTTSSFHLKSFNSQDGGLSLTNSNHQSRSDNLISTSQIDQQINRDILDLMDESDHARSKVSPLINDSLPFVSQVSSLSVENVLNSWATPSMKASSGSMNMVSPIGFKVDTPRSFLSDTLDHAPSNELWTSAETSSTLFVDQNTNLGLGFLSNSVAPPPSPFSGFESPFKSAESFVAPSSPSLPAPPIPPPPSSEPFLPWVTLSSETPVEDSSNPQ